VSVHPVDINPGPPSTRVDSPPPSVQVAPSRSPEPAGPWARLRHPHIRDVGVFGLFIAIFAMALRPVVDNDLFWHLATGRYIWATGAVPHADPFSWTAPGRAWIAHEWLTETLLYPLYTHGGYPALMLVWASVITAAFAVSYATARLLGAARPIAVGVTGLAAVASDHTWGVRPQMLSLLLTALTVWVLTRAVVTGRARALWGLPPLLALWANLHGGFIFGLVIIGLAALARTCEGLSPHPHPLSLTGERGANSPHPPSPSQGVGKPTMVVGAPPLPRVGRGALDRRPQPRGQLAMGWGVRAGTLWLVFAASLAACLINPNGLKGLIYPFTYLGDNASTRYIAEWVSPNFHQGQYQLFEALILALVVGVAFSPRRPRLADVLLALLFTHLALVSVRNINLFSIVVAPLIAVYLSGAWRGLWPRVWAVGDGGTGVPARRYRPVTRPVAALNLTLAAVIAGAMLVISAPNLTAGHNTAIQAQRYPAGAVAYLRARHLQGPMLNSYDWGGYLIWNLYPRARVYIDGRPDMYGDRFVDAFVRAWQAQPGWQATLRRQGVRLVLVEPTSGLGHALAGAPGWRVAYRDKVAVLYARAS